MTKYLPIVQKILTDSKATPYLDNLLEVFTRGYQHNNSAQFHFLACVFANLSATLEGAMFFMAHSTVDNTPRLNRLLSCTENKDVIRRGGVISTLKNCCFCIELHSVVLENDQFLTSILLPLCGNETFDEEVLHSFKKTNFKY